MFEEQEITKGALEQLSRLVDEFRQLELEEFRLKNELEDVKKKLERVSRESIPTILNDSGLSELKLSDGRKVVVKDQLKANIKKADLESAKQAMADLEDTEEGKRYIEGLFAQKLFVDSSEEVQQQLIEVGLPYTMDISIHHQTLAKYCRTLLESGRAIPEIISVFQYQETKIK